MDEARRNEILEERPRLEIDFSNDPTIAGPGYIADKVAEAHEKGIRANTLWVEVVRALDYSQNKLRSLRAEKKIYTRQALFSEEIQSQRISFTEKKERAEDLGEEIRVALATRDGEEFGEPLHAQITFWEGEENSLKSLRDIMDEAKGSLKHTVSSARLKMKAIEAELFHLRGGQGAGGGHAPVTDNPPTPEGTPDPTASGDPDTPTEWESLQG